jgi:abhydrolase domain-containing protein 17
MMSIAVTALVAWVALAALAWLVADRMIFMPPPATYNATTLPIVHVQAEDGVRIAALHLPNDTARFAILYSHGNAEDLGWMLPTLEQLRELGFAVVAYDYRGYGASTGGPPTTAGVSRDIAAVYAWMTRDLGIPPERVVLYGRSLGSGPATELAAREPVAGLILESAFTSAYVVLTRFAILPFDRFPNIRHIRDVNAPVLVIHGTRDEVIPFSHGRRLHDAVTGPRSALWVEGARHNDVALVAGRQYRDALRAFEASLP